MMGLWTAQKAGFVTVTDSMADCAYVFDLTTAVVVVGGMAWRDSLQSEKQDVEEPDEIEL